MLQDEDEESLVAQKHLNMLRNLLLGVVDDQKSGLFFWAYDFKIIPIQLISQIYEEFYRNENSSD